MSSLARQEHAGGSEVQDIEHGEKFAVNAFEKFSNPIGHFVKSRTPFGKKLMIMLILVNISLDPLFFYIPVVDNDSNCFGLDNTLRIIVVVFRTSADLAYIVFWWRHQLASLYKKRYGSIPSWMAAILAVLPLPQVVVYAAPWRLPTVKLLKFIVLIQSIPRVYLVIPTYRYARKDFNIKSLKMWLAAAFYLSLFILASNVLGAFWYLRAIERNMDCWRKACKIRGSCGGSSLYCGGSLSNNSYLHDFCPMPPAPNSTFFDHGIYLDAFKREIIGIHTSFLNKFFYCLWWGLQSLSSLGQNLEPGTYIWDNFFAIFIVISGLVLLALLIGNMQVYLQKETASDVDSDNKKQAEIMGQIEKEKQERMEKEKRQKMERMKKELGSWPPFYALHPSLRREVTLCEDEKWLLTTGVNLESILNNPPRRLRREIKLQLCKNLFSKVKKFEQLHPLVKEELRERAQVVIFQARSTIYSEGYPIYEMIHIVEGKVLAFNKDSNMKEGSECIRKNDSIGKELLDKALDSPKPNLPLATETLQALTKVEAFRLSFDDFVTVFTEHGQIITSYKNIWAQNVLMGVIRKKFAKIKKKTSLHEE